MADFHVYGLNHENSVDDLQRLEKHLAKKSCASLISLDVPVQSASAAAATASDNGSEMIEDIDEDIEDDMDTSDSLDYEIRRSERRTVNFAAGPAKLPRSVLQTAQEELLDYQGLGISVMEISHRSPEFLKILEEARARLRRLLSIPDNYQVLFLQGGGTGQFSAIPMNLLGRSKSNTADYFITGCWSAKASKEAEKYGKVHVITRTQPHSHVPPREQWTFSEDPAYIYYCDNETVHGVEFPGAPNLPERLAHVPLVADMSSNILSRHVDIEKYGVIIAGAQKNIGCAGVTVVIIRDDLLDHEHPMCPAIFSYKN